jgi:hypothetical protein
VPAVVGTPAETAISTASTSHVVNLPAGATGNLLVAIMQKGSAGTTPTVNALTGWTELLDEAQTLGLYIAYRVCDGTEGSTTTFTLSSSTRGAWIVYEISGAKDPAVQAPQIGTTATGSGTTPNPPSVSVAGGSKEVLTIACFGRDGEEADDDTWVTAAPSGFSGLLQKACGTAGTNLAGMIATASLASKTATSDPGTFTCATGAWRAQTIVIHSAPAKGFVSYAVLNIPSVSSTPKAGTDSGSGAETKTITAQYPRTETGAGADASAERAVYARTDSGAGSEVSAVRVPKAGTDTGAGTDASLTRVSLPRTDAGTGTDPVTSKASAAAQAGISTDASTQHVTLARTESGAGADASLLTLQRAVTDAGAGADASSEHGAYARADSGAGVDASSLHVTHARVDTGAGSDTSSVVLGAASKAGSDAGSGADVAHLVASLVTSEAPVGFDLGALASRLSRSDAGVGTEAGARTVGIARGDSGTAGDVAFLHALTLATDSASVLDTAAVLALLSIVTDVGVGLEHAAVWKGGLPPARMSGQVVLNRGAEQSTMQDTKSKTTVTSSRPSAEVTR